MTIASEILKAQNNLKDCYDVCKSVEGVVLPDDKNFDNLPALIEQALNPFKKPSDWSDIRTDCPANSIALLAGHTTDYSQYDNLGFTANCVGGYNVFIDGTQYGSTYASGSQCNITWSSLALTTGDDITTPTTLKAHKIWITPATEGNNITDFRCVRVAASGVEEQGVLWAHLNLTNTISLGYTANETRGAFGRYQQYKNQLMKALTAKNNIVKASEISSIFYGTTALEYAPVFDCNNTLMSFYGVIWLSGLPKLTIKNAKPKSMQYFASNSKIEKLDFINGDFSQTLIISGAFDNVGYITKLPYFNFSTNCTGGGSVFISNATSLTEDYSLDLSNCVNLPKIVITNTPRFKGLRVSNEAPFNNATAPQIDVSYTGMDRNALVQLFNDLPIVSAGQIISIVGATGASDLTADDEAIATAKGWTITK